MTQRVIHRPARHRPPDEDLKAAELIPPPNLPDASSGAQGAMQILMPIMGGAGSLVMILANKNPMMLIAGGIMLAVTIIGAIVMAVMQRTGVAKRNTDLRRRYLEYLDRARAEVLESTAKQRRIAEHHHPPADALLDVARNPLRLWERRPGDADFLTVRIGTGSAPLWQRVSSPPNRDPLAEPDIVTSAAVHRIVERDQLVSDMPVGLPIAGRVSVVGPSMMARDVVTAALAQLVTLHSPEEVQLMVLSPRRSAGWLDWLKWMPHALSADDVDGTAPQRMVTDSPETLASWVGPIVSKRVNELTRGSRLRASAPASAFGQAIVLVIDAAGAKAPDLLTVVPPEIQPASIGLHSITISDDPAFEPERVDIRAFCSDGQVQVADHRPPSEDPEAESRERAKGAPTGTIDRLTPPMLRGLTRELTAVRMVEETATAAPLEATLTLADLTGVTDPGNFDPRRTWTRRAMPEFLNVPFGLGPSGERVHLDIKENALGGMGPHGLCVGATGSGKSEVLRTIVLCMTINHPPERLALVLVDYKGGATFAGLEDTPHCAAMISNLSDDDGLVDRLHDALFGEMKRRQQLLAMAGNLPNITEYNRRRDAGEPLEPLPNLFCVIDEFGELLTAKPDFIELFLAIGRIGRSIGVHLLLASQRLEEGRLRGLESYLSYRLGLRTFNAAESRTVLGVPDAYELPPIPGSGYLAVDTTIFQRFKAGYVSGTYKPPVTGETVIDTDPVVAPFPLFNDTAAYLESIKPPKPEDDDAEVDDDAEALLPTVLDVAVRQMAEVGTKTMQIWLPPLPKRLDLDVLAGETYVDPVRGLRLPKGGNLKVPVGLLDKPAEQSQEPYLLDLATSGGHLAIIGAPQTGKSTLLRTIITSAALTHMPGEVAFYCLDLGGGALRAMEPLPHVAGVAVRLDSDRVRRTVAEVSTALNEREEMFSRNGIDSVEQMRERFLAGRLPELSVADIFLVVDNWPVLKNDFDDLVDIVQDLGTRGPGYGVHLLVTTGRWSDIRTALQAAIGTKIEFRINDPLDSQIGRKFAQNLRADTPGRAIIAPGLQVHVALPTLAEDRERDPDLAGDGESEDEFAMPGMPEPEPEPDLADELAALERRSAGLEPEDPEAAADGAEDVAPEEVPAGGGAPDGNATEALVARIGAAWQGERVPKIRMLPTMVDYAELRERAGERNGLIIGIDEAELRPVELDLFGADQHLLVFGDSESGKTNLLRTIIDNLVSKYTDDEVVFAVFDVRRSLLGVVPEAYLGGYVGTTGIAEPTAAAVAGEIAKRMPPDDVTAQQLRERSWWSGPEIVVLVDDYDLLSTGGQGPLGPFLEFLPQSRDLGLHLVIARRSGGASRAMYEPIPQRLRELGATGLLLSGDRQEGQLFPGLHMQVQPPGRGHLIRRGRRPQLIQLAFKPEELD